MWVEAAVVVLLGIVDAMVQAFLFSDVV